MILEEGYHATKRIGWIPVVQVQGMEPFSLYPSRIQSSQIGKNQMNSIPWISSTFFVLFCHFFHVVDHL